MAENEMAELKHIEVKRFNQTKMYYLILHGAGKEIANANCISTIVGQI